jgi:hypothetical protein
MTKSAPLLARTARGALDAQDPGHPDQDLSAPGGVGIKVPAGNNQGLRQEARLVAKLEQT